MHWLESLLQKPAREVAKSAHLPAPLIARLKSGKPTNLSPRSRKSLYNAYRRNNYATIRKSGHSAQEARNQQYLSPDKLLKYIDARWREFEPSEAKSLLTLPEPQYDSYVKLRDSGATIEQAEEFSTLAKKESDRIADRFMEIAQTLSKGNGIKVEDIIHGMRYSTRVLYDWDVYISKRNSQHWTPLRREKKVAPGQRVIRQVPIDHNTQQYQMWKDYRDGKRPYARDYEKDSDLDV
jgi:hypothetical protein